MKLTHRLLFIILMCCACYAYSHPNSCSIEVRFLQSITNALPGQIITIQAEIINTNCSMESNDNAILVAHLDLPPLWKAIPSNDILIHFPHGQSAVQTLTIQVPETASSGEYSVGFDVWAQKNRNHFDRDQTLVVIGKMIDDNDPITLEITSPSISEINPGDVLYVSACATNPHHLPYNGKLLLSGPTGWSFSPSEPIDLTLEPGCSKVMVYALKVPTTALAGEHPITLCAVGCSNLQRSIIALVKPSVNITGFVENMREDYCLNQYVHLNVRYTNSSNVPLRVAVQTETQPHCIVDCPCLSFELPPHESFEVPICLKPDAQIDQSTQFLLVRLVDANTGEQLYQNPMTLKFIAPGKVENDSYVRIPAYFKTLAVGDHCDYVFAVEYAGEGLINKEEERYLSFFFRLPTQTRRVIYNIDQRLFLGVQDQKWNINLGDTVYELSPLTQRFRYGRGAGLDRRWEQWSAGIHYTKNTISSSCDPKEICSYLDFHPTDQWDIAINYLNKTNNHSPTSNIVTLQSNLEYPRNVFYEFEIGKDFIHSKRSNSAYRFEIDAKLWKDSWFSFEKIFAGPYFFGYYHHVNILTSSLDIPLSRRWRFNFSLNRLQQNFDCCDDDADAIIPRQRQYDVNFTYRINPTCSLSFNGMLLFAKDLGLFEQYDFCQKWAGSSFSIAHRGYNLNAAVSFGQQQNHVTHHSTPFLQRYYFFLSKNFSNKLCGSLFYDGGNTNFYDAGPWRNTYGGSICYRPNSRQWFELFAQRVKQSKESLDLSQITINFNTIFTNLHVLQGSLQYYKYCSDFPNDFIFLISYTIPLQMPVCKRRDIGDLHGVIYNEQNDSCVSNAMVRCGLVNATTDEDGRFSFRCIPSGEQNPRIEMLPDELITVESNDPVVDIRGGAKTSVSIPVIPSCSIHGNIMLYGYKDLFAMIINPESNEIIPLHGLESIRVAIEREGNNEIYTTITNIKGEFHFHKLRPGNWRIKVMEDQLPSLHQLNFNDLYLDVKPADHFNVSFYVKPTAPQVFKLN